MLGTSPQSLKWNGDNFGGKRIEEIALYAHGGAIELPLGPDGRQLEGSLDAQTTFTRLGEQRAAHAAVDPPACVCRPVVVNGRVSRASRSAGASAGSP